MYCQSAWDVNCEPSAGAATPLSRWLRVIHSSLRTSWTCILVSRFAALTTVITAHSKQQLLWADHRYKNKDEGCSSSSASSFESRSRPGSTGKCLGNIGVEDKVTYCLLSHSWLLENACPFQTVHVTDWKCLQACIWRSIILHYYIATVSGEMGNKQKKQSKQTNPHPISLLSIILDG